MKQGEALLALDELVAAQWGLVTSAQARAASVPAMTLSRLVKGGHLVHVAHGVYRDGGASAPEHEELRAAWLATEPADPAWRRLQNRPWGAVVSGASAAVVHGIGDFRPVAMELTVAGRKQTQRRDLRYRCRELPAQDVTLRDGLPVTTRERTIADLVEAREDLSTVADALRDAVRRSELDTERLTQLLAPLAARNGHAAGDGEGLLDDLLSLAGLDLETTAAEIAAVPTLGNMVIANRAWTEATRRMTEMMEESMAQAFPGHQYEAAIRSAVRASAEAMAPVRAARLEIQRSMQPVLAQLRDMQAAGALARSKAVQELVGQPIAGRSPEERGPQPPEDESPRS